MGLTGEQYKELNQALIKAFPSKSALKRMLQFNFDENLEAMVGDGSLKDIVFDLVQEFSAEDRLLEFVQGARKENPNNPELKAFEEQIKQNEEPITQKSLIGKKIDQFEIKEYLGTGGMGIVYAAWDTKLESEVALKFLHSAFNSLVQVKQNDLKRFEEEAKTLAKLDHANVCVIREVGKTSKGQAYIVMPLYRGKTLKEELEELSEPLDAKQVLNYAKQIAEGLNYIHQEGIIHRDIKPANIIITDQGIRILDFGFAKLKEHQFTTTTQSIGTVAYMSPEQLRNEKESIDHRTDIWTWGVVLFEMLVGEHPFGESLGAIGGILHGDSPHLNKHLPDDRFCRALQNIIDKSLAKIVEERYQLFEDVLVDLKHLTRGELGRIKDLKTSSQKTFIRVPIWAKRIGVDLNGEFADLVVENVRQRFRWIDSGKFWMGSPESEQGRYSNETRHKVRISKGFWLADTVCTQALWKAVMGKNPSHFKDDDLPVEQVSWNDTQVFIKKLNGLVKGLKLRLPTEAEWEYCCRAGTETPFSFGETINSEQANFNGNYPYANGKKSEYRKKPVIVRSLPCNHWGLYEMHGNLWEWCEDWYGDYKINNEITVDPRGSNTGPSRVLRGGSWSGDAGDCRSAYRDSGVSAIRSYVRGFRLVSDHQEKTE